MAVWTDEDYAAYLQRTGKNSCANAAKKRKSKYNSQKTWCDGICFDSKKEAEYYCNLKLLCRAGELAGFTYHGNMIVTAGSGKDRGTMYETDFILLFSDGTYKIVDTKGVRTDVYKNKIKGLREKYPKVKIFEE